MDRLAATKIFLRVAETHSFTAVARELGVGQPAVSKTVAALEHELGVTLVRRTSRSVSLTRAGQALLDEVRPLIAEVEETFARLSRGDRSPAGIVRVAVAPGFGRLYVVPAVRTMRAKYPEITVEIAASDRHANLVEENIDLAIRGGELRGVSAVCQRVGETPLLVVGSAAYLERRGQPEHPADLAEHDCIVRVSRGAPVPWRLRGENSATVPTSRTSFRSSNAEDIRAAVLADLGLAQVPGWLVAPELAAGTVRAMMRPHEPPPQVMSFVRPGPGRAPARVRVVMEALLSEFAREPLLGMRVTGSESPRTQP